MPTIEDLRVFGHTVRSRRLALGHKSLRSFAAHIGVSPQHLSQLERAYVNPKRGMIVPSDEVLDKLAKGLNMPLSRLHALLGRLPDVPYPAFDDPEAMDLAERFMRLPPQARKLVLGMLELVEKMVRDL